jgi:hypothetical protein
MEACAVPGPPCLVNIQRSVLHAPGCVCSAAVCAVPGRVRVSVLQQSVLLDISAQQQPVLCQNVYGLPIAACAATGLHVSLHVPVLHPDLSPLSHLCLKELFCEPGVRQQEPVLHLCMSA